MSLARAIREVNSLEQALGVLDAGLPSNSGFARADPSRKMPSDAQPLCPRLGKDGEIGFTRHPVVNLDEIHAQLLERVHGMARVFGRSQRYAVEDGLLGAIEERARSID